MLYFGADGGAGWLERKTASGDPCGHLIPEAILWMTHKPDQRRSTQNKANQQGKKNGWNAGTVLVFHWIQDGVNSHASLDGISRIPDEWQALKSPDQTQDFRTRSSSVCSCVAPLILFS